MKSILRYINANVLFRVANLNSITIITKILAGILTSKAIALFIGVEGMALIGNVRNFVSAVHSFSILGFYNGLVKSIANAREDLLKLSKTISSAYYFGFVSTLIAAFFCYYNAEAINDVLFSKTYNYAYVIQVFAVALPFYALNMFSFAIMNGFSNFRMLLVINIIGQILGLLITLLLIYQYNIDGALIAAVVAPSIIFLITLVGIVNRTSLMSQIDINHVDMAVIKRFFPFAMVALVTTVGLPMVSIFIRNYIIAHVGIVEAGYWEAMNRVSDYYLMFVMSIITLYLLPRFTEISTKEEFRHEVLGFYKSMMPIFGTALVLIYLLRSFIVSFIFSADFQPTTNLFLWQLLGDFIKVLAVVIAYNFLAKRMFLYYILIEGFLLLILYLSSVYFIDLYGVKGAVIGHFVSYLIHFVIVLFIFGNSLFNLNLDKTHHVSKNEIQ